MLQICNPISVKHKSQNTPYYFWHNPLVQLKIFLSVHYPSFCPYWYWFSPSPIRIQKPLKRQLIIKRLRNTYMPEHTTINRYHRTFENNNQPVDVVLSEQQPRSARRIHRTATNHSSKIRGPATNNSKRICQAVTNQSSRIHLKSSQSKIKDPLEQQPMGL